MVQGVLLDEVGTDTGQIPLRQGRQPLVQQARDREIQHGVPQELQPLIVIGRKTAVRGGALEKGWIGKNMLQAGLQRLKAGVH
ncbi:hypothetical protein GmRootA79_12000 [Acidovorax sp. A79]